MAEESKSKEEKSITSEVLDKMINLIMTALSLVAALAWNQAIQALFKSIFGEQKTIFATFGYAVVITVLVVMVTIQLSRFLGVVKEKERKLREKIKKIATKQTTKKD